MSTELSDWRGPERRTSRSKKGQQKSEGTLGRALRKSTRKAKTPPEAHLWLNPELHEKDETANLDTQDPPTLYYLGRVVDVDNLAEVYVERRDGESLKHWAILNERDYDAMDEIYDIELDTHDRFPMADLGFRIAFYTEDGPTVSDGAVKIYDAR